MDADNFDTEYVAKAYIMKVGAVVMYSIEQYETPFFIKMFFLIGELSISFYKKIDDYASTCFKEVPYDLRVMRYFFIQQKIKKSIAAKKRY